MRCGEIFIQQGYFYGEQVMIFEKLKYTEDSIYFDNN